MILGIPHVEVCCRIPPANSAEVENSVILGPNIGWPTGKIEKYYGASSLMC
jgi:hypothetical protein